MLKLALLSRAMLVIDTLGENSLKISGSFLSHLARTVLYKLGFIWSAKVSNANFNVAILTYAKLTLGLHVLTIVC